MARERERTVRLGGIRCRVSTLSGHPGSPSVQVSLSWNGPEIMLEVGRSVADHFRLGDTVQLWIEKVEEPRRG